MHGNGKTNVMHVQVAHEEGPNSDLEKIRARLGSVGKTAVMESGALVAMIQEALGTMHKLADETQVSACVHPYIDA